MAKRDFAPVTLGEIVQGKRSITADTALRLGRYFGTEAQFWLNLQTRFDLLRAEEELDERLDKEVTPHAA
jgi:antitoxin HigA-1